MKFEPSREILNGVMELRTVTWNC